MSITQSNAFPNDSAFDIRSRVMGTNLPDDTLPATEQIRQRAAKITSRYARKTASGGTPGGDGATAPDINSKQRSKRSHILKIAGISVGSVVTVTGVTHMNEVLTLAKDWGPGSIVLILAFLLLFNVPLQWSKYKNDQEDRSERKDLFMAILNMQERTTDAISGLGTEVRANTDKIDQLILVLSSRACMVAVPQVQIQPAINHHSTEHQSQMDTGEHEQSTISRRKRS